MSNILIYPFISADQKICIVYFIGDASIENINQLKIELERIANINQSLIIFDFKDLGFLNSQAVGLIVNFIINTKSKDQNIAIINPQDNVKEIIELVYLDQLVPVKNSLKSILEQINFKVL